MEEDERGRATPLSHPNCISPQHKTAGHLIGERVQVRTGWAERPAVGTVIDADALGITIETGNTERLIPWTAITSVRMGRA